ncbi:hypothetical protein [Streptomyces sp. NPDC047043]|uniref:hypothetical protein n=1 Tax=Streptomyces sp. NPDC047043 TaxID=3154497 RepID=UPI0033D7FF0D
MRTTATTAVILAAVTLTACTSDTDPVTADVQAVCRELGFNPGDSGDYAALPDGVLADVSALTDKASGAAQKDGRWWTLTGDLNTLTSYAQDGDQTGTWSRPDQQKMLDAFNDAHRECADAYDAG